MVVAWLRVQLHQSFNPVLSSCNLSKQDGMILGIVLGKVMLRVSLLYKKQLVVAPVRRKCAHFNILRDYWEGLSICKFKNCLRAVCPVMQDVVSDQDEE